LIVPDGQLQAPLLQTWPPAQLTPQAPQLLPLDVVSTQAPPQFVRPPAPPSVTEQLPIHVPW
jgi:hypothetical protein